MLRCWVSRAIVAGVILATQAWTGHAASPETQSGKTIVRSGDHPGFGRVVVETNGKTAYRLEQNGDHVVVRFNDAISLATPPPPPRNVASIKTDGPVVELTLNHGVVLQPMTISGRVVLDMMDASVPVAAPYKSQQARPAAAAKQSPAALVPAPSLPGADGRSGTVRAPPLVPAPAPPALPAQSLALLQSPPSGPALSAPAQAAVTAETAHVEAKPLPPPAEPQPMPDQNIPEVTQQVMPGRDVMPENEGPVGLLARRVKVPKGLEGSAFLVPFDNTTGAASFQEGDATYIVFDERRPVDMSPLRNDPVFAAASVQLLPNGTLFRVPLPPSRSLVLTQMSQGWRIAALTASLKQQPVTVSYMDGRLSLAAEQPGDVVNVADPETGATLLVGTQRRPGQGMALSRRSTEFVLRPTLQGVVVEPLADAIVLKQVPTGFSLTSGQTGLALSPPAGVTDTLMDAARLTSRLTFSNLPTDALVRLAKRQLANAANAPPLARGLKHHAAAESFLSLGMAAEAESLLHLAAEQDPKEAASPDTGALTAIAALLAGRPDEADGLADPKLTGTDEIALWRAIRQAMADEGSPAAAVVFATTAPLALQYPKPIRDRILPLMLETMIQGGEIAPAARLLEQNKDDPTLAYASAMMHEAEGDTDQALATLDKLAAGHDRYDRARAATRAVELRLAARKFDKAQAADALDKLLFAWRGDARELELRERVADLRGQAGAWRNALSTLRQAETDFPDQAVAIHERLKDTFAAALHADGARALPAIDFVALMDESFDLLSDAGDDDPSDQSLADRLLSLDLPDRAKPVLEKLMKSTSSAIAKARFGASLATLQAREGNDTAARATLDQSDSPDLPSDLVEQRAIIQANAVAHLGAPTAAAGILSPFRTVRAIEARAQILETASDWAAAEQAWSDSAALTVPESGTLADAQMRTVLRLATAATRASDDAGLTALRVKFAERIGTGPLADMFRLLTAEPIRTTADISRSKKEMSVAASLPADLKALQASSAPH